MSDEGGSSAAEADNTLKWCEHHLNGLDKMLKTAILDFRSKGVKDERLFRVHLILSELAELCEALASRDEVGTLDALADITYVVFGTAATYDLPLDDAFDEVHRSNMSKDKKVVHAAGISGKGKNYVPPNLEGVLQRYRRLFRSAEEPGVYKNQ